MAHCSQNFFLKTFINSTSLIRLMQKILLLLISIVLLTGCLESGQQNNTDQSNQNITAVIDSDNDGYPDNVDAFPLDPSKHTKKVWVSINSLPVGVDVVYKNAVLNAMTYWSKEEGYTFREYNGTENITDEWGYVRVTWVKEYATEIGTYWGSKQNEALITIGLGDSLCYGNWRSYTYDSVLHITKHEFGHLLGFNHSNDVNDLMYNFTSTQYVLDFNESNVLSPSWASFYPVCSRKEMANYSFQLQSFYNLDIFVISSHTDYDAWMRGEYYTDFPKTYYPECSHRGVHKYIANCTLNTSGGIVLINRYEGVTVAYNITAKEQ